VPLGDVASIDRLAVQPEKISPGTIYVGLEDIAAGGALLAPRKVDPGDLASRKFAFTNAHVLYGKLRPYLAKVAAPDFNGVCSTDILPVLPGPRVDRRYLLHFLRHPSMVAFATSRSVGINLPRLSPSILETFPIPLPPVAEQRRVAGILDRADAGRAMRRAVLAQVDSLTQAMFFDMFGDPVSNHRGWPRVEFGDLLLAIESGWSPRCLDRPAQEEEWGVLKLGAVTSCDYKGDENKALPPEVAFKPSIEVKVGDLLFTRKNTFDLIAACAYVRETRPRLMMSDLIFRLRLKPGAPIAATYLQQLLTHAAKRREIQKLASGSAGSMPNISKGRLSKTLIELPPIELQRQFAERLDVVERMRAVLRSSTTEVDALFASLQQRAFRGEL
jgi:type I restriction enzyme, S subunit